MEELDLGLFFLLQKLDIVDQEEVRVSVLFTEIIVFTALDRRDELVDETLAVDVNDLLGWHLLLDRITYGMHQVGLTETGTQSGKISGSGVKIVFVPVSFSSHLPTISRGEVVLPRSNSMW